jgi:hypothetical protein
VKYRLLNYLVSTFSRRTIRKMAKYVGERPDQIKASLINIIPAIICGTTTRSAEGLEDLAYIAKKAGEANRSKWSYSMSHIALDYEKLEDSEGFLIYIFGGNHAWKSIAEKIADQQRMKLFSSITLMQILTPICLSNLGKNITDHNMSLSQFASLLKGQKRELDEEVFEVGEELPDLPCNMMH